MYSIVDCVSVAWVFVCYVEIVWCPVAQRWRWCGGESCIELGTYPRE